MCRLWKTVQFAAVNSAWCLVGDKVFILQFLLWSRMGRNSDKAVGTRRLEVNTAREDVYIDS